MPGHIRHSRSTVDGNEVVLTAGTGLMLEILQLHCEYTSSGTAGNRRLLLEIKDSDGTVVADYHAGAQQGASVERHYTCARGIARENNFVDTSLHVAIPFGTVLLPNWTITIRDTNAVDVSGDVNVVNIIYQETNHNDGDAVA